jgi:hypothetical protein
MTIPIMLTPSTSSEWSVVDIPPHLSLTRWAVFQLHVLEDENSQILRRPQDDIQFGGSFANAPCGCHPERSEGPCIFTGGHSDLISKTRFI